MDSYSHEAFQVTGYKVSITNMETMMQDIAAAWDVFLHSDMGEKIEHKAYPGLHCVYFNFKDTSGPRGGYDMLIGYVTTPGLTQSDSRCTTVTVPAQNYKYKTAKGNPRKVTGKLWGEVNAMSQTEVARAYGYDLEMYNEAGDEVTVAVSVI